MIPARGRGVQACGLLQQARESGAAAETCQWHHPGRCGLGPCRAPAPSVRLVPGSTRSVPARSQAGMRRKKHSRQVIALMYAAQVGGCAPRMACAAVPDARILCPGWHKGLAQGAGTGGLCHSGNRRLWPIAAVRGAKRGASDIDICILQDTVCTCRTEPISAKQAYSQNGSRSSGILKARPDCGRNGFCQSQEFRGLQSAG